MNFRYDLKHNLIAPQGRAAQTTVKKTHKVLDEIMRKQSEERNNQFSELESMATMKRGGPAISPATVRKVRSYEAKAQRMMQQRLLHTHNYSFDFGQVIFSPINSDTQFLTLPFDSEWLTGPGVANKNTGELSLGMLGGNITVGSGLGLFISSPSHVIAYVRALMPIDYQWGHVIFDSGFTASTGTVGILVYETRSAQIVADKRATLWNESMWMASIATRQGEDRVFLSQTKAAEVSFHMLPGKKYQVWFWLNIDLRTVGLSIASALIQAKIPLVILNTTPPPKVN